MRRLVFREMAASERPYLLVRAKDKGNLRVSPRLGAPANPSPGSVYRVGSHSHPYKRVLVFPQVPSRNDRATM